MFITTYGTQGAYTLFPAASNSLKYLAPLMGTLGLFGSSLSGFQDLNGDGIREIVVGAPGDDDGGTNSGAVMLDREEGISSHMNFVDHHCNIRLLVLMVERRQGTMTEERTRASNLESLLCTYLFVHMFLYHFISSSHYLLF